LSLRDQGYQPYRGTRTPAMTRWRVVFRHTLRMGLRQPWAIVALSLVALWGVGWAVGLYLSMRLIASAPPGSGSELPIPDPAVFAGTILVRWYGVPVFAFLMAMLVGGSAIADDRRQNAFSFYFARSLGRDQYLAGKLVASTVAVAVVSAGAALLMALVRLSLYRAGSDAVLPLVLLPLRALALGLLEALALAAPALALSSLSTRRGLAQGGFAALFFLPAILGAIATSLTRSPWPRLLSPVAQLEAVGVRLFGDASLAGEYPLPWLPALVALGVTIAGSVALVRWRLAATEVVAG
jgi:ABC-type transport system involved in multi-copper enzyme maturation permease subunit